VDVEVPGRVRGTVQWLVADLALLGRWCHRQPPRPPASPCHPTLGLACLWSAPAPAGDASTASTTDRVAGVVDGEAGVGVVGVAASPLLQGLGLVVPVQEAGREGRRPPPPRPPPTRAPCPHHTWCALGCWGALACRPSTRTGYGP
jgi:hypothetical protein